MPSAVGGRSAKPADAPITEAPPILDEAALEDLRRMSGDDALVARVARLYCLGAPDKIGELRAAVARADLPATASAAHALKSMSLNIGARAVANSAENIERGVREHGAAANAEDVERLAGLAEETFALLRPRAA